MARGDWSVRLLAVLTGLLLVAMVWSVVSSAKARHDAAVRAEQTLVQVSTLVDRVDRQAADLDRHASELARIAETLEVQGDEVGRIAARLETSAEQGDQSRAQFQQAVRDILAALQSDADPFTTQRAPEPEPTECTPPQSRRCRDG